MLPPLSFSEFWGNKSCATPFEFSEFLGKNHVASELKYPLSITGSFFFELSIYICLVFMSYTGFMS